MPRRRAFGYVFRRKLVPLDAEGHSVPGFRRGWSLRVRRGGRSLQRYPGPDRETAVEYANRLARATDRRDLL